MARLRAALSEHRDRRFPRAEALILIGEHAQPQVLGLKGGLYVLSRGVHFSMMIHRSLAVR